MEHEDLYEDDLDLDDELFAENAGEFGDEYEGSLGESEADLDELSDEYRSTGDDY